MRKEEVEIFSDQTGSPVLRHPGRKFPGVLIQGDALHALCQSADRACESGRTGMAPEAYAELNKLRNALWDHLQNYKRVLTEHDIGMPFNES